MNKSFDKYSNKKFEYSLIKLFEMIRKRPKVYLGEKSLSRLSCFINGATYMWREITEYSADFISKFDRFVHQKYNDNTTKRFEGIIQSYSKNDEEAFDTYFELLNEYLALSEEEQNKYIPQYIKEQMQSSEKSAN